MIFHWQIQMYRHVNLEDKLQDEVVNCKWGAPSNRTSILPVRMSAEGTRLRSCCLPWYILVVKTWKEPSNHPRFIKFQTNHSSVTHFWVNILTVKPMARWRYINFYDGLYGFYSTGVVRAWIGDQSNAGVCWGLRCSWGSIVHRPADWIEVYLCVCVRVLYRLDVVDECELVRWWWRCVWVLQEQRRDISGARAVMKRCWTMTRPSLLPTFLLLFQPTSSSWWHFGKSQCHPAFNKDKSLRQAAGDDRACNPVCRV